MKFFRHSKTEKKLVQSVSNKKGNKRSRNKNEDDLFDFRRLKDDNIDWNCVCVTLDDWNEFPLKYKKSRKRQDQDLYNILKDNYLNEMPDLFHKAVRFHELVFLNSKIF